MKLRLPVVLFLFIFGLGLYGCAMTHRIDTKRAYANPPGSLIKALRHHGVQVIQVGETTTIVMRSDDVFAPNSANIKAGFKPVLNELATLIYGYDKVNVNIKAYTDNLDSYRLSKALTRQQASNIARYLWSRGLDARLLFPKGYGSANPVASNHTALGRFKNRRIVIKFRYLIYG